MALLHKNNNLLYSAEHQWKSPQNPKKNIDIQKVPLSH